VTQPRNPADAITVAAQRINATRDATKTLAEQIAADRTKETEARQQNPTPEGT
jgi:hypothetical protein